jgi:hypothetical protein
VSSFYCMILLSTEHSSVFFTTTKRLIEIQRVFRAENCVGLSD